MTRLGIRYYWSIEFRRQGSALLCIVIYFTIDKSDTIIILCVFDSRSISNVCISYNHCHRPAYDWQIQIAHWMAQNTTFARLVRIDADILLRCGWWTRDSGRRNPGTRSGPGSSWTVCRWASDRSSRTWIDGRSWTRLCGVSVGTMERNAWHRGCVSIAGIVELTIFGLNGGCTSRLSIFSQSMRRKNRWPRTSSSPRALQPSRLFGFLVSSCLYWWWLLYSSVQNNNRTISFKM